MKQSVAKTMEAEEIIAMRCKAHGLSAKRPGREIVRGLCGLQSQFTMQARHALTIRADDGDAALADCVRTWTMRGTMHTILREDVPLYLYDGRTHALRLCDRMADDEQMSAQRKRALGEIIREAIRNGEGEREALRQIWRANGMTGDEERSAFDAWGGLLRAMAENGEIAYAAEKGKRVCAAGAATQMGQGTRAGRDSAAVFRGIRPGDHSRRGIFHRLGDARNRSAGGKARPEARGLQRGGFFSGCAGRGGKNPEMRVSGGV